MISLRRLLLLALVVCLLAGCSGERDKGINSGRDRPQVPTGKAP